MNTHTGYAPTDTHTTRRWLGYETCPGDGRLHVLPVTITSTSPLTSLQTPGNITDEQTKTPCPGCIGVAS